MEPAQTTYIYIFHIKIYISLLLETPQKPRIDPSYGAQIETFTDSLQKSYRSFIQGPYRNLLYRKIKIPCRETFQKSIMHPSYGALIINPLIFLIETLYLHCKETRQKPLVDPSYRALEKISTDSIENLCRSSIYIETLQKPLKNLLS